MNNDISDSKKGITDDEIYKLFDLNILGKLHYLCFGYGSYGGGLHHISILILSIENGEIVTNQHKLPKKFQKIEAYRKDKINIEYNEEFNTIAFNEFELNTYGRPKPTGNRITLKLSKGKFVKE